MPVSEHKGAAAPHEDQVARLQAEVEALKEQLRRSQRLATVGTMAAMVAHEFNNILTPVINSAQMARRNPALVAKAIDRAADGGQRATDICRAILGFARTQAEGLECVDLERLTAETLAAMARSPAKDNIELRLEFPPGLTLTARRVELQQVILNLVLNARNAVLASRGLREIHISAEAAAGKILYRVRDTGVGIPPENLERIFMPFFSTTVGDNPDSESQGHGLGLTVCREIVAAMGGDISVESSVGVGSCFTLHLPV